MLRFRSDRLAFFPAHAADLQQALRLALHDLQRSHAEYADDLLCHRLADALDNAGRQIPFDVLGSIGEHPFAGLGAELQAVGGMGDEAAGQPQAFALLGVAKFARRGH